MAAECKIKNELGTISVVEDVITTVAGYAAIECIGIVAMASKRATDGLVELLGRENLKRGVRAVLNEDSVSINLYIIVEYGVSIAAVAKNVVETVKYRVENLVGVKVDSVNVTVEGSILAPRIGWSATSTDLFSFKSVRLTSTVRTASSVSSIDDGANTRTSLGVVLTSSK